MKNNILIIVAIIALLEKSPISNMIVSKITVE
jgi:hypothetical protein